MEPTRNLKCLINLPDDTHLLRVGVVFLSCFREATTSISKRTQERDTLPTFS